MECGYIDTMKRTLLILLSFLSLPVLATNYYVKTGGDDGAAGTSDGTAWATIAKINSVWSAGTFAAGDSILLNRGDTFYGSIIVSEAGVSGNPITIGAYGTGAKPIINCMTTLSSWTLYSGNIYYASLTPDSRSMMVTIDGEIQGMGRWPNTGYNTIDVVNASTEIVDYELPSTPDWDGGEIALRKEKWVLDRHPITSHSGTTITFTENSSYNPRVGWGYFIQNHLSTLDVFGEWFYSSSSQRLYVDFGGYSPSSYSVKASSKDYGIYNNGYKFIHVVDISIVGANVGGVHCYFPNYDNNAIVIDGCDISYSGKNAIFIQRATYDTITNNTISNTNNCAIITYGASNSGMYIDGNVISHTGEIGGLGAAESIGGAEDHAYNAIHCDQGYTTISNNRITYTGYLPINFRGQNTLIESNFIDHFLSVIDDGAGIYVYNDQNTGKVVRNNIVMHGVGSIEGTPNTDYNAHAYYSDGSSTNISWTDNVGAYVTGAAFHANMPQNEVFRNNVFFQCEQFLNFWKFGTGTYMNNMLITQNVFVSSVVNENLPDAIYYINSSSDYYNSSIADEITHIGEIDSNYYYLDTETAVHFVLSGVYTETAPRSFARWTTDFGHDDHSTVVTMDAYTLNSIGSNLLTNGTFNSNISGWTTSTGASASWNSSELGDGGCIQLTSTIGNYLFYWWSNGNCVSTSISGGVVDADTNYVLRFLGKSAIAEKSMAIKLYSTGTGYDIQRFFTVGNTAAQKEVLFTHPADVVSGASMRISLGDGTHTTYLDNVGLYVADVTLTDWDDYLHLVYNDTDNVKYYSLSAAMDGVDGTEYSGTIGITPWSGLVLIGSGTITDGSGSGGTEGFIRQVNGHLLRTQEGKFLIIN